MLIKIVKNQMGKTAEEIKPFPVIGPVPDDHLLLNECEFDMFKEFKKWLVSIDFLTKDSK